MTSQPETRVRLRPLSLVDEGDEVLVGEPESGTFVSLPAVGGVVLRALQRGASIDETAREAEEFAGEPVDIPGFVETLGELGFLADDDPGVVRPDTDQAPQRTAPIQGRRWLYGLRPELARLLFGRVAWSFYAGCGLFNLAVLLFAYDQLWPRPADDAFAFRDIGLSALVLVPFLTVVVAMHECWHWIAARAVGAPARFGIDRRAVFLVFETDLSRLWTLPRNQRYGPLLAGIAFDSIVLAAVQVARLGLHAGVWSAPGWIAGVLAMWAFALILQLAWQCMIFLRTDLYAVFVNATGCRNLWRIKTLLLRRAFGRLTPAQAGELAEAHPADVRVGRWFRWLWLAGFVIVAAWFYAFLVPVFTTMATWAADGLALGPLTWQFWYRAGCAALVFSAPLMVLFLTALDLVRRARARVGAAG
jgi:hypothetical protein